MYGFIYITTNKIDGKKYIGMCSYHRRGWQSYLGSGKHLMSAVRKHGRDNFERRVIGEAPTKDELFKLEQRFILDNDAVNDPTFYNLLEGKYKTKGFRDKKHTPESNTKRSETLKGRKRPAHVLETLRQANIGRPASDKQRAACSINGKRSAKPITIDGITYPSVKEAAQAFGKSPAWVHKWYPRQSLSVIPSWSIITKA